MAAPAWQDLPGSVRRWRPDRENMAVTEQSAQANGQPHRVMRALIVIRPWPSIGPRSGIGSASKAA